MATLVRKRMHHFLIFREYNGDEKEYVRIIITQNVDHNLDHNSQLHR